MDDRNRRDERSRRSRSNPQQYDQDQDYGSQQAEQFDDSSGFDQDQWSRNARDNDQMGDARRRPIGVYYEEVTWRAPSRDRYGQRDQRSDRDAPERLAARERNYGGSRYDNGLDYYTSESQGGRDFSRRRANNYGARPDGSYSGGSYVYGDRDRHGDNDRGFMEKAGDEIASWFGDEDAARRRRMDHRGSGPANYTRSDERILEDACDCLTDDWQLDARNIQVTVNEGEVTLDGTVDDRGAKRRAEDVVEDISGVKHVQNNLRVKDRDSDAYNATSVSES